jgi:predicted acetyltransferase
MTHLEPVPPNPEKHLRVIGQLAADAFAGGQYVDSFCDNYIGNSHYDWDVSRLVLDSERLVHHWGVWGYDTRLDSARLKVGGIGAVVTHPDYRTRGLMHRAAEDSFRAMREAGYHLSILRGRHYVKMGYARAWNYVTYRFRLPGSPPGEVPCREFPLGALPAYERLGPSSIPEMDALYNRTHEGFAGTAVRPTFRNKHHDDMGVYAWRGDDGSC